jgi:hypothetical protein
LCGKIAKSYGVEILNLDMWNQDFCGDVDTIFLIHRHDYLEYLDESTYWGKSWKARIFR